MLFAVFVAATCKQIFVSKLSPKPTQYRYNVIVEILPSTEERESKVETFISSLTLPGKDHRIDKFSREYNYLKEELGINLEHKRRKVPATLRDAVHEIEDLIQ